MDRVSAELYKIDMNNVIEISKKKIDFWEYPLIAIMVFNLFFGKQIFGRQVFYFQVPIVILIVVWFVYRIAYQKNRRN